MSDERVLWEGEVEHRTPRLGYQRVLDRTAWHMPRVQARLHNGEWVDATAEYAAAHLARELSALRAQHEAAVAEVERLRSGIKEAIGAWLPDMHEGEECVLFGGEGCLACNAQRDLAALAAPADEETDRGA